MGGNQCRKDFPVKSEILLSGKTMTLKIKKTGQKTGFFMIEMFIRKG